jgi:hypothetical protein
MIIGHAPLESESAQRQGLSGNLWPPIAVAATVAWNLWQLRATVVSVQYPDDNAVHQQMVRFATTQIRAGHDPLTTWFPYLGLGSPQFLHYQSTPAILTGLAGLVVGPGTAFRWSLYLLWCLWPVAIYASARLFGLRRAAATAAAMVAPFLHSVPGIGYEQHAYLWAGYGVWTQLWGSWALPFAWALSWRAAADRRFIAPAAALVALTAAFHYETGYLAFAGVLVAPFGVWPFKVSTDLRARLVRAAGLLAAALLASAWVIVPLLLYSRWAGIDQAQAGTALENGYGARTILGWLLTGRMFDAGHLPVITLLVAAGLLTALLGWRRAGPARMLVVLFGVGLLLSFGRTTFGGLVDVIPGSTDVFFRRFMMGTQLAGIYLAGLGAAEAADRAARLLGRAGTHQDHTWPAHTRPAHTRPAHTRPAHTRPALTWAVLAVAAVAYLFPAWRYLGSFDVQNSSDIHFQQLAQADEPQAAAVTSFLRRHGGGRVYAGSPSNWGQHFTVGFVPMYAYLESQDIDEVGYTLRTASLMTQPEYHFDAANPGDYALFGIRYVVLPSLPTAPAPPRGSVLALRDSLFRVFELPGDSYIRVADTVGSVATNRADVGSQTVPYLRSALPGQDRYLTVSYAGARAAAPTLAGWRQPGWVRPAGPAGTVLAEHPDLTDGTVSAAVRLRRRAAVVLSASFDPGWSATVDGRPAPVEMVAPALVAVTVPPGTHHLVFRYRGFGGYPELLALAGADLVITTVVTRRRRGWPATLRSR